MTVSLQSMANAIRALSMDAVEKANSGHPGMPMGMADVATVLFTKFLKYNPNKPNWFDRDRFILSAGHGSMLLYSLLYLTGYEDITLDEIKNFRQLGAKTNGHPEFGRAGGIETTTGPLGQGIANAVGFAMAEKLLTSRFGETLCDHYTYTIAGDGCLMEGISQEAISLAGHLRLNKLIVLFDDNGISIDGPTSLSTSENHKKRFEACGWNVMEIDGHDFAAIEKAIKKAKKSTKPTMIACKTTIAKGAPTKAGTSGSHGSPLGAEEIAGTRKILGWNFAPFEIPEDILNAWREAPKKGISKYRKWNRNLKSLPKEDKANFVRLSENKTDFKAIDKAISETKKALFEAGKMATRKASGDTLKFIANELPEVIGGSADLTGSNLTKNAMKPISADDFSGSYVYWGIREHGMCAAMNGMSLHGGLRTYGGTFFVFTDYCKPSIRLAALMHQPVIYVMTHDSIGLGEDGPTHQPVEHLASMRAIPNINIIRPADCIETAEAWELALKTLDKPTMLVLTRQNVPLLRKLDALNENLSAKGAYVVFGDEAAKITILATGSEVGLSVDAAKKLSAEGISAKVVSIPCFELFDSQSDAYKNKILGKTPRIAVEAACEMGWCKYLTHGGNTKHAFIGLNSFGDSAPAEQLYEHFGITENAIIAKAKELIA